MPEMAAACYALDTSVPLIAQGAPSPQRDACRSVLALAGAGKLVLIASTELIQEFVFHRTRMTGDAELAVKQAQALREFVRLIPFDEPVLDSALALMRTGQLRGRDSVHAATAVRGRAVAIITVDSDFAATLELLSIAPNDLL